MIYIIGAGAIGQALAVMLHHTGQPVTLIRVTPSHPLEPTQNICVRLTDGRELIAALPVKSLDAANNLRGPLLVTSKSYGNEAIAAKLAGLNADGPVILLQNGLEIERPFLERHFSQIYRCVLMVTSQFGADGTVEFKPVSACPVGVLRGEEAALIDLLSRLNNPWFAFVVEKSIQLLVWQKVVANCIFNSICPLLEVDNGIFHRDKMALAIARRVITECVQVAGLSGIALDAAGVEQLVLRISRSSDGQLISTLQDIRARRATEISTLNQAVVRLAGAHQAEHLVTETRLLGELTEIKSQLNR